MRGPASEVTTRRDEAVADQQRERLVDGDPLDDAVQVEAHAGRGQHELTGEADGPPHPALGGRAGLDAGGIVGRGITVVAEAGGAQGVPDRRVDEAVGLHRCPERGA